MTGTSEDWCERHVVPSIMITLAGHCAMAPRPPPGCRRLETPDGLA